MDAGRLAADEQGLGDLAVGAAGGHQAEHLQLAWGEAGGGGAGLAGRFDAEVEDPEIPISVVHMGLIVDIAFDDGIVDLKLTFTAMGCPAMEFIQDDIRERLMQEDDVHEVRIEIVWDPVWTRKMIREEARETMRGLGIVA